MNNEIKIDSQILSKVVQLYYIWKDFNKDIKEFNQELKERNFDRNLRSINIPDFISEPIACHFLNLNWKNKEAGDCVSDSGIIHEVKSTSMPIGKSDLTSFSPSEYFGNLVFLQFDTILDKVYIYDLKMSRDDVEKIYVNKSETFKEQADAGRRPRFSVIETIIKTNNVPPHTIVNLKEYV